MCVCCSHRKARGEIRGTANPLSFFGYFSRNHTTTGGCFPVPLFAQVPKNHFCSVLRKHFFECNSMCSGIRFVPRCASCCLALLGCFFYFLLTIPGAPVGAARINRWMTGTQNSIQPTIFFFLPLKAPAKVPKTQNKNYSVQ